MGGAATEISDISNQAEAINPAEKTPERRYSRNEVLQTFNSTLDLLRNSPQDQLTQKEQANLDLVEEIKGRIIDKGKAYVVNRFKDEQGTIYRQREYIPVDDIIDTLTERIKSGQLSEDEAKDYAKRRKVLIDNSKPFYRLPDRSGELKLNARVRQEFERIQKDPRLTTGDPGKDWLEAANIITKRRELILPRKEMLVAPKPLPTPEPVPKPIPEPEPDPEPKPIPIDQLRRDIAFTNRTTDPRKRATELAEEFLRSEMRRGSILNPLIWGRKIGLRIMEEHWRQRLIKQIETSMLENENSLLSLDMVKSTLTVKDFFRGNIKNLNLDINANKASAQAEGRATSEQLRLGAKEGTLISGQKVEEAQEPLQDMMISEIIRPLVEGKITEDKIQEKLREFVNAHQDDAQVLAIFGPDANQYGRIATYFATDLKEAAQVIKDDIKAHKYAIKQLNEVVRIQLANTDWAAETEAKFTKADKAIAWAERHRLTGLLANPAVIGAAFSLGTFATMRATGILTKASQWLVPGAGLLPAAAFAAYRRNYDLKVDRASHQVERAYNMKIPKDAKRREALEKFAYNTASVEEMLNGGGQELLGGGIRLSMSKLLAKDLSSTSNQEAIIRRITEMKTRLDLSAEQSIDLVTFENRGKVSQGRLQLIESIAKSRIALRKADMTDDAIRRMEGKLTGEWKTYFIKNREQQDKDFKHYKLKQSIKAGIFGGAVGLAGAYLTKEIAELIHHAPEIVQELPKISKSVHQQIQEAVSSGNRTEMAVGNTRIGIEGGRAVIFKTDQINSAGQFLAGEKGLTGTVDSNAALHFTGESSDSINKIKSELAANGFQTKVEDTTGIAKTENVTEHFRNLNMVEKANRGEFLNNRTSGVYDRNELRLHISVSPDGAIDLDLSKMIQENTIPGSVNSDIITNPDGSKTFKNFEFLITPNSAADDAREVIKITAGPDGHAKIPKGADLSQFFDNSTGKPKQLAKFVEVAHINADGKRDILATSIGSGNGIENITVATPSVHTLTAIPPETVSVTPSIPHISTGEVFPGVATPFAFRHPLPANKQPTIETGQQPIEQTLEEKREAWDSLDKNPNLTPEELERKKKLAEEINMMEWKELDEKNTLTPEELEKKSQLAKQINFAEWDELDKKTDLTDQELIRKQELTRIMNKQPVQVTEPVEEDSVQPTQNPNLTHTFDNQGRIQPSPIETDTVLPTETSIELGNETIIARQEVFEKAGKRSLEEVQLLIDEVSKIQYEQWVKGNGKLGPTITEIRQAQETTGTKEAIYDEGIVYLPNDKGQLIVVGDIHGDLASTQQIIEKAKFLENMEQGDKSSTLVFLGDFVDRGQHDVEVMEVLLELKHRYPDNVILMKADHEVQTGVSGHDFPKKIYQHYYKGNGLYSDNNITNIASLIEKGLKENDGFDELASNGSVNQDMLVEYLQKFARDPNDGETYWEKTLKPLITTTLNKDDQRIVGASIAQAWRRLMEEAPLNKDYFCKKIFNSLPRMVVCGNGVVLAHGGPSGQNLNLAEHRRQWNLLDKAITWADPTIHMQHLWDDPNNGYQATVKEVDDLLNQAELNPNHQVNYNNKDWPLDTLKIIKNKIETAKRNGAWFNTGRIEGEDTIEAVWQNLLLYSEESVDNFLKQVGGTVMIRGHQVSTEVMGYKPNPFSKNNFWTIHSTGMGSDESYYKKRERNPSIAVFNKNEDITEINPSKNIVNIWTGSMPTP